MGCGTEGGLREGVEACFRDVVVTMSEETKFQVVGKSSYREAVELHDFVPLWQQPWWLDVTAGETWDVLCLMDSESVVAALPYVEKRRVGLRVWSQPPLTQSLGPWIASRPDAKYERQLSNEHALLEEIVQRIPENVLYVQNWQPSQTNWLPFYWARFTQSTRYTYRIDLTVPEEQVYAEQSTMVRRSVKKAAGRYGLSVSLDDDIEAFLALNEAVFARQGLNLPYSKKLVREIHAAAQARNLCDLWMARDPDGRAIAGAYIVRDKRTAYYLLGGADPELRKSGAQNLVMWEAIRNEIGRCDSFDFEGSMVRGIERSFRSYGAQQVPYFSVLGSHRPWLTRLGLLAAHRSAPVQNS